MTLAPAWGLWLATAAVVVALAVGWWVTRSGRRLTRDPARADRARDHGLRLGPADLGDELGERATLVHFSSAFCAPCRATRRILESVADGVDGVRAVEIDAESNLALVRRLDVRRTPTVLVLDAGGRIVRRASGAPRRVDVIAALGQAVP